jgi:hypothetical protein
MIQSGHPLADQLQDRVRVVQGKWAMLNEEAAKRRITLVSGVGTNSRTVRYQPRHFI